MVLISTGMPLDMKALNVKFFQYTAVSRKVEREKDKCAHMTISKGNEWILKSEINKYGQKN